MRSWSSWRISALSAFENGGDRDFDIGCIAFGDARQEIWDVNTPERPRPERVRVSGPARRRTPVTRTSDIDAGTRLGGLYMGSLLREQLRLALRILLLLGMTVGTLPLVFHLMPRLGATHVLGIPLAWLVLGVLVYPYLFLLGWLYVRRAERNERDFADLMGDVER